jgi:hypothetical protein
MVSVRAQSIPEFGGVSSEDIHRAHGEWINNLKKLRESLNKKNITYGFDHHAETTIYFKGKDY